MHLRPVEVVSGMIYIKVLSAREFWEEHCVESTLLRYEAECASSVFLERCAARLSDRIAGLESRMRVAPLADRSELTDELRTFRSSLTILRQELARSQAPAQRRRELSALRPEQPRLRLVESE
jgi:hypothetical protein